MDWFATSKGSIPDIFRPLFNLLLERAGDQDWCKRSMHMFVMQRANSNIKLRA